MPRPYQLDPMASLAAFYGAEQRRYREMARMTQAELATKLNYSEQMIAHIESARRTATPALVAQADEILDARGALIELAKLVAALPNWFDRYRELEAEATDIHIWDMRYIPGLLQTQEYADAVVRGGRPDASAEAIHATVAERTERQKLLDGTSPVHLSCVISEAALRQGIGSPAIMQHALRRLLDRASRPHVTVQILPFANYESSGNDGPFIILEFDSLPDVAYAEGRGTGRLIDQQEETKQAIRAYDRLRAAALSPDASAGMILAALENHWEHRSS